jgi:transglutaminase-like putative cysteine protease
MRNNRVTPIFDWTTLGLLILLMMIPGWALSSAEWTDYLSVVSVVGAMAVLAGTALAQSRFSGRLAALFSTIYGIFFVVWRISLTLDRALLGREKVLSITGRVSVFFTELVRSEPSQDPLMFVLVMSVLFWILGVVAAWRVFRYGGVWSAIIPAGLVVLFNTYFYVDQSSSDIHLAGYFFVALLLIMRLDLVRRGGEWQELRSRVPTDAAYRISRAGAIVAFALVSFSWIGPTFARQENAAKLWSAVSSQFLDVRDFFSNAFNSLRVPDAALTEAYGDDLLLDAGEKPKDTVVLEVEPERMPGEGARFYWRSRVYDKYENGRWTISAGDTLKLNPSTGEIQLPAYDAREVIEVVVFPKISAISSLYVPTQPIWVNRTSKLSVLHDVSDTVDILKVVSNRYILEGESYRARASVATPTAMQLRKAGEQYPDWVLKRYLQVPSSITPRTLELAREITGGVVTPYDKAVALTTWLRKNITYNRITKSPPQDIEPLDWFLFEYKTGYCNFYASAQVIMLRTLGIPARLSAGYARGTFDPNRGAYIVQSSDSHSWPEVFFPGYGWVEFEPTVSQTELTRPEPLLHDDEMDLPSDLLGVPLDEESSLERKEELLEDIVIGEGGAAESRTPFIWRWLLIAAALVLLIALWVRVNPSSWYATRRIVARGLERVGVEPPQILTPPQQEALSPTGVIYRRWTVWLARLGLPLSTAQTPYERATEFASRHPQSGDSAWSLVKAYARERFGDIPPEEKAVKRAYRTLQPQLALAWFRRLVDRFRARRKIDPHKDIDPRRDSSRRFYG